jgi:hypothetical protein
VDLVHKLWTGTGRGPWWTEDRGDGGGSPELMLMAGSGHGQRAGLYLGRMEAMRRWSRPGDGVDRWQLLGLTGVAFQSRGDGAEGGKRCGVEWGCSWGPFIGSRREAEAVGKGVWQW